MLLSSFVEHEVALEIAALFTSCETSHVIQLNMAAQSYRCDPCGKNFDYKSKYERHLESQVHKDKVYYIEMTEEENYSHRTLLVYMKLMMIHCCLLVVKAYQHRNELKIVLSLQLTVKMGKILIQMRTVSDVLSRTTTCRYNLYNMQTVLILTCSETRWLKESMHHLLQR